MVPRLDLGGSGPCLECDSPHLFGERCAPELSSTTRTSPSEHLGACGHELDPWESHLEHAPDCRREICIDDSHCTCPEVCPDCCRSCGYDLAERMGS